MQKKAAKEAATAKAEKLTLADIGYSEPAKEITLAKVIDIDYNLSYELEDSSNFNIQDNKLTASKEVKEAKKLTVTVNYKGETAEKVFYLTSGAAENYEVTIATSK